jgi:hypothetical protein
MIDDDSAYHDDPFDTKLGVPMVGNSLLETAFHN